MKRLICVVLVLVLLCGCVPQEEKEQQTVFCMDTVMDLQVWGENGSEAITELKTMLQELEATWSATTEDSLLAKLNREEADPDQAQQAFLDRVMALSKRTGGAFDPRLHSLVTLWGFPTDQYHVPTQQELEEARKVQQWDLGGAVKGYAGELAVEKLQAMGVGRALLNLGGNVQTYGQKADGAPWQIAIQAPDGGDYLGVVSVKGTMAVVTAGDYQRYFEENGVRYHHILDPETGRPANSGLRSVTVICADGLTADVLSTALFVLGLEGGIQHWRQSNDFEAVFVLNDGRIFATQGVSLTGCAYEVICREE